MKETSLFIDFMGDSPMVRVFDYLMTEAELDFSKTDMAENAGIGRSTLYRIWDQLIENKIILHTRDIGKAKLFKLNTKDPRIKKLMEIFDMLILDALKNKAREQNLNKKAVLTN